MAGKRVSCGWFPCCWLSRSFYGCLWLSWITPLSLRRENKIPDLLYDRHGQRISLRIHHPFSADLLSERAKIADTNRILQEANDKLKREFRQRRKLEQELERASKMEAVGALAGGVAHDLNNILSGLVSYPDLILMDLPPNSQSAYRTKHESV